MPNHRPLVAISILNWNGWRDTLECLESIRKLTYADYLITVVDNGSRNDSAERIKAWALENLGGGSLLAEYTQDTARQGGAEPCEAALRRTPSEKRLVLIRNQENLGFTGGCNVAFHYALHRSVPADYVFLLNNDARIEPDCLTRLMAVAKESGAGIIGAVMFDESGKKAIFDGRISMTRQFFYPLVNWQLPPPVTHGEYWPSDCVHGGAMVIRRDVLLDMYSSLGHYFRDDLFMYMEGAEFHHYAARLGYQSFVAKNALVYHKNARSSGGTENPLAYYYSERNLVLVGNVVLPPGWKFLFHLVNVPLVFSRILKNVVRRRWSAAAAILSGMFDGYRGAGGKWKHHDRSVAASH